MTNWASENHNCVPELTKAALTHNQEYLRLLLESLRDPEILLLDPTGYVVGSSSGIESQKGYRIQEVIGQHFSCFFSHQDVQLGKPERALEIASVQGQFEEEGWSVRKDGTQFWANVVITRVWEQSGQLCGFLQVTREMSTAKHLEESHRQIEAPIEEQLLQLQQINQQLQDEIAQRQQLEQALLDLRQTQAHAVQSEKMSSLGQLVAGVAHEINNPVNVIYYNLAFANDYTQELLRLLQLYRKHYPNPVSELQAQAVAIDLDFLLEDLPKLFSSMKIGAYRIRQLVASLRNFSRMDEAEMKVVNIHEGIDSTLMILQSRLKAKSERPAIEVIKNYGDLPQVECYVGQLNQVFMNILSNALDALEQQEQQRTLQQIQHSPSQIRICTEHSGANAVRIRIADNGPGMSKAVQQRLFDPFYTTKAVGKGTGLRMSISYQIVTENHGGSLQCISAPGQGTEFVIEIPVFQPTHRK